MKKAIILSLFLVLVLSGCSAKDVFSKKTTKDFLSAEEAQAKATDFINKNLMLPGSTATIKSIEEDGNFYKLVVDIGTGEVESYLSKDGTEFLPQVINIQEFEQKMQEANQAVDTQATDSQAQVEIAPVYTDEDKAAINGFVTCLAEKNVKIYGANWCGYTKSLVNDTFGGFDAVAPIYVECTEQADVCDAAGITGYPTIIINGENYQGERTFAGLAEVTGCTAPVVSVTTDTQADASCAN